jgi:hypothetical protein
MSITIRYSATINGTRRSVDIPLRRFGEENWAVQWATVPGHQDNVPDDDDIEAIEITWFNDRALYEKFWGADGKRIQADIEAWHMGEATDVVVERVEPWPDTLHLTLRTSNNAFREAGVGREVARILRKFADRIEDCVRVEDMAPVALVDLNGASVGNTRVGVSR